jgi:hypothetical protein
MPPDRVTVSACIGCGDRALPRPCTGDCDDRRLELVAAAEYEQVAALAAVSAELAASDPGPGEWEPALRALQARARDALASGPPEPEAPAERVDAWWCATCGRIEAPRSCVGICVRQPEELVRAALYDELAAPAQRAAALVRTLAHVTPRDGQWERTGEALRSRARAL